MLDVAEQAASVELARDLQDYEDRIATDLRTVEDLTEHLAEAVNRAKDDDRSRFMLEQRMGRRPRRLLERGHLPAFLRFHLPDASGTGFVPEPWRRLIDPETGRPVGAP